jgi:pimeloyl-ACP methyl ester carboxylesterase
MTERRPEIESETPIVLDLENGARLEAQLGWVTVPVRHSEPDGPTWRLAYARLPSRTARPGAPIVVLVGGPGESGIESLGWGDGRLAFFEELRELGDVIALDQRGTGWSWPVPLATHSWDLPLDEPLVAGTFLEAAIVRCRAAVEAWRDRGLDIGAYTVLEAADDVELLRRALGAERLRLVGASYGAHLGFAVLRRHGERIERAVLGLVEGPDHTHKLPSRIHTGFEVVAARAREAPELAGAVPDMIALAGTLRADLAARPLHIPTSAGTIVTGPYDLQRAIAGTLGDQVAIAGLPAKLLTLARGDGTWLGEVALDRRRGWPASLMTYHTDAASGASLERRRQIADEAGRFLLGDVMNHPFPTIEEALDRPDMGDAARAPLVSDVPVQFQSGTLDGRTPISNVDDVIGGFSVAGHLVVDGVAHDEGFDLPEVRSRYRAFLAGDDPVDATAAALFRFESVER